MNKKIVRCFLSLFASALMAHAAQAENSATFTLFTPCYYMDNMVTWEDPDFVSGTRGSFTSFESFPATATYYCESDSGYHVSKWVLRTAGLSNKTIQTWTDTSRISITFDYKWAAKYGTSLELIVYVDQISYTLSYDANGGSWTAGEPEGGTYQFSGNVTAPASSVVEREGYDFKGWKSSRGSLIAAGALFNGSDLGITSDGQAVVLYAQWQVRTYTYDVTLAVPEGASVKGLTKSSSDEDWDYFKTTYVAGKGLTLPKATKTGSTFVAWYDNPNFVEDSDAKLYSKVTKIGKDETGDKEYWAKFETELAIHYDGNGSSSGTMADQEFTAGKSISLSRNKFEKVYTVKYKLNGASGTTPPNQTADYTFAYWNTKKDGTGDSYEDGQTVTFDKEEAVTLYAQWEEEKDAITLPDVDKWSGHTFSGWWTQQSGGTCVGYANDKYAPSGNITLYAHWDGQGDLSAAVGLTNATLTTWCTKKSTYEGVDNVWSNYVEMATKNSCLVLNASQKDALGLTTVLAMSVTGPGKVTYKMKGIGAQALVFFDGKSEKNVVSSIDWTSKTNEVVANVSEVVQVRWTATSPYTRVYLDDVEWHPTGSTGKYTVTAEPSDWAGGTVTGGGEYESGKTATLRAKPKTGWKFIGWKKDGVVVSTENPYEVEVTANATYTAVLADEWYYISYNKNGGTGSMDKQLVVRDTEWQLAANAFTRTGYTFAGWNTAKDGSGTAYADKATVKNLALSGSTATLYAQWKSGSEEEKKEKEEQEEEEGEVSPEPGPYASAVGEAVSVDLAADCAGYTIKSVSGLPTGLKYNKSTGLVTGTPTKAVSKEGNVTITFADKTKVKATWTVEALPAMMVGTYYGAATVDGIAGQFQLKLLATGKATGYFYAAGKKITLKSTALAAAGDGYGVTVSYTYNKVKYADEILLMKAATVEDVDIWSAVIDGGSEVLDDIDARRDTIKACFGKVVAKATTYDVLAKTDEGEYLKAKVTTAGAVTVSGKLLNAAGKLTSVSCSTHLVVGDEGEAYCHITIYKTVSKSDPIVYEARWVLPE